MIAARLSALRQREDGVAAVEFAMLAPAMILLLSGTIEAAHFLMVQTTLEGAVTNAARENAVSLTLDEDTRFANMSGRVEGIMQYYPVANGEKLEIETQVYASFGGEAFEDLNGNGRHDEGETYIDRNGNKVWDKALSKGGRLGDVGDVVSYRVTYPVDPFFPFLRQIFGGPLRLTSSTVARNEPERSIL
ncbi:TadE/TadG family type IV pilus assembly protein [Croceibacterium ferulae]|uniref:TadE/TadG family type IV pilus assembly protein n=1 Tax=Croceibacterium ferulae TaxID=1854641 RepID=UPI000EAE1CD3|nr:TadE family protein [Croceibacterium ferulae]